VYNEEKEAKKVAPTIFFQAGLKVKSLSFSLDLLPLATLKKDLNPTADRSPPPKSEQRCPKT
jgi:hypothetical protein